MSDQKTYNAADPKQVKKRVDKAKRANDQRDEDFKQLLGIPAFRRFLWHHIHARCSIFQTPFNPNGSVQTHNIGRQSIGLELWADIERVDASLIPRMMQEYAAITSEVTRDE